MSNNYCLVQKNKIYEELYDVLEDEELIMDNPSHKDNIKNIISKKCDSYMGSIIKLSKDFASPNETLEELMVEITQGLDNENLQGNTLMLFADDKHMYDIIFLEEIGASQNDGELNQFMSISNIELSPIYGNTAIIKSSYENSSLVQSSISKEDVINLLINNFYHKGVLVNIDGSLLELEFAGDNPNIVIGGNFKMLSPISLFGLTIVGFQEDGKEKNKIASDFYGKEIYGRFFIAMLCPISNKKFWNLNINLLNNLMKLLNYASGTSEQKNKINELEKELNEDKLKNPLFLIKKYCV